MQTAVPTEFARRDFLGAGAALAGIVAAGPLLAQQPSATASRVKGAPVWLDMDQTELDAAYDQSKYAPNLPQITKRYATNSEAVRSRIGAPRRVAYGPTAIERLDIYATNRSNAPINVFLHGGAWRVGLAEGLCLPSRVVCVCRCASRRA
jgi:arylformamidase